jgi:hypothetical protein
MFSYVIIVIIHDTMFASDPSGAKKWLYLAFVFL